MKLLCKIILEIPDLIFVLVHTDQEEKESLKASLREGASLAFALLRLPFKQH